jgi:hypothetical protein
MRQSYHTGKEEEARDVLRQYIHWKAPVAVFSFATNPIGRLFVAQVVATAEPASHQSKVMSTKDIKAKSERQQHARGTYHRPGSECEWWQWRRDRPNT